VTARGATGASRERANARSSWGTLPPDEIRSALLTEHGRQQALAFREKDTCEANFRAEMNVIGGDADRREVRGATFKVTERSGDRATVRLTSGPYIEIDFTLVKTDDRWLIEDSEAVPYGD
jgi:hypothetical protein